MGVKKSTSIVRGFHAMQIVEPSQHVHSHDTLAYFRARAHKFLPITQYVHLENMFMFMYMYVSV